MTLDSLYLRFLIVEDSPTWREDLRMYFSHLLTKGEETCRFDLEFAETRDEALMAFRTCLFHGVSLDQRLPLAPGNSIKDENGLSTARELRSINPTSVLSFFTAFPNFDFANQTGALGIPYKVKDEDGHPNALPVIDYARFHIREAMVRYIDRVLDAVTQCGFDVLREPAHKARTAYAPFLLEAERAPKDRLPGAPTDQDATDFLDAFFRFQENFAPVLCALVSDMAGLARTRANLSRATAAQHERWLEQNIGKLDDSDVGINLRRYLGLKEETDLAKHICEAMAVIRRGRNGQTHQDRRTSAQEFLSLRPAVFRLLDLAGLVNRLPFIHQPVNRKSGWLDYTSLNHLRPESRSTAFVGTWPDSLDIKEPLFTLLPGSDTLLPLGRCIRVRRDPRRNTPTLYVEL